MPRSCIRLRTCYNRELNPSPPQLLYDTITDHAKDGVVASDAVDHVLNNAPIESPAPATTSPN